MDSSDQEYKKIYSGHLMSMFLLQNLANWSPITLKLGLRKYTCHMWDLEAYYVLLDSSSRHYPNVLQLVPRAKEIIILMIAGKTMGRLESLHVPGFRIWKNFVKIFLGHVILLNHEDNLHYRNSITKLQSLIHDQVSVPRFKNMFKHTWYKSG